MTVSNSLINVRIANLSTGGVAIMDRSRTPASDNCKVLGIGVAVRVKTWISLLNCLSLSLCCTPKCCSSSMIRRPRFLNLILFARSACVPTTISILPLSNSSLVFSASFLEIKRDNCLISIGKPRNLSKKLLVCCLTKRVVGAITAT